MLDIILMLLLLLVLLVLIIVLLVLRPLCAGSVRLGIGWGLLGLVLLVLRILGGVRLVSIILRQLRFGVLAVNLEDIWIRQLEHVRSALPIVPVVRTQHPATPVRLACTQMVLQHV